MVSLPYAKKLHNNASQPLLTVNTYFLQNKFIDFQCHNDIIIVFAEFYIRRHEYV